MALLESKWARTHSVTFEWQLVLLSLILSCVGLCLIFSATSQLGDAGRSLVMRQITWCSLGLVIVASFLLFDYHVLERWAVWFYVGIVVALVAVWALGKVTAGSRRWIELGLMRFQPSEFAKLAVVIILARYFQARAGTRGGGGADLIQPILLAAIPIGLVLIQPDLGTAGVIFLISVSMILFAGVDRRVLLWTGGILVALIPLGLLAGDRLLMDYQKKRLLTFLEPELRSSGSRLSYYPIPDRHRFGWDLWQGISQRNAESAHVPPGKTHGFHLFDPCGRMGIYRVCSGVDPFLSVPAARHVRLRTRPGQLRRSRGLRLHGDDFLARVHQRGNGNGPVAGGGGATKLRQLWGVVAAGVFSCRSHTRQCQHAAFPLLKLRELTTDPQLLLECGCCLC